MICRIEEAQKSFRHDDTLAHLLEMGILSSDIEHRQEIPELSDQKDYQVGIKLRC